MWLLAVLAALPAAGATTEREQLECLGTVQQDLGRCVKAARERCEVEFRGRLPACFADDTCPSACIEARDRCDEPLLADRDGCRLACQADQKAAMQGCRIADDPVACRAATRTKSTKCRERCTHATEKPLRECRTRFGDCLRACARPR